MRDSVIRIPALLAAILALAACGGADGGGGGGEPDLVVTVAPQALSIEQGGSQVVTVTAVPSGGFDGTLTASVVFNPAAAGISLGPLSDWHVSGAVPVQRPLTLSVAGDVPAGDYSATVSFLVDGDVIDMPVVSFSVTEREDSGTGPADPGLQIALGDSFVLLLDEEGTLWAWGSNWEGALTRPNDDSPDSMAYSAVPVEVTGLPEDKEVLAIAASDVAAFALLDDGSLWSWGEGSIRGRQDAGTRNPVPGPVALAGEGAFRDIERFAAGSDTAFAWRQDTGLWAWGANNFGQMGHATSNSTDTPQQVLPDLQHESISQISLGGLHVVAHMDNGTVRTWGAGNSRQLGDGVRRESGFFTHEPVTADLTNVATVSAGNHHTLALLEDGTVWSWGETGSNDEVLGHDGDGWSPGQVVLDLQEGTSVLDVAGGWSYSLVLTSDGEVLAWGINPWGQLGNGTRSRSATPVTVQLPGPADAIYTAPGARFSLALLRDGSLWGWGEGHSGVLGVPSPSGEVPDSEAVTIPIEVIPDVRSIAAGDS